jgi:hypothetical protein
MTASTHHNAPEPKFDLNHERTSTDHDGPEQSVYGRLLDLSTMDVRFRTLTAIVIGQVVATAFLVLFSDYSFGDITVDIFGVGPVTIGLIHYGASVAFLLTGLTLFVTGLGGADLRGVGVLFVFFFAVYLLEIVFSWRPINISITILVTIVLFFVFCLITSIAFRRAILTRSSQAAPLNPAAWLFLLLPIPWTLAGLYAVIFHPVFFYTMQFVIGAPFILLYPLAAVDWAEIADSSVGRVVHLQEHTGLLLFFATIATALPIGIVIHNLAQDSVAYGYTLFVSCVLVGVLGILLWIARFHGDWPIHFPWPATALLIAVFVIFFNGAQRYVDWFWISLIFATAMAVLLCVCGRNRRWQAVAPTALLGVLIGVSSIYFSFSSMSLSGFADLTVLASSLASVLVGVAVIRTIGRGDLRRQGLAAIRYPVLSLLTLSVSLLAIYLLAAGYELMLNGSDRHVVEALVVAAALLSELFLAGHSVTNVHTEWFPRSSRLLMYFGFLTFTLAYTLSIVALHGTSEQLEAYKLFFSPENAVHSGILLMGPATLWALFILRLGRWLGNLRNSQGREATDKS